MSLKQLCVCLVIAYGAAILSAQDQPAATPAQSAAQIQLAVVVTDKAGNPIPGLKQEDFKLTDNKQSISVGSFAEHGLADGSTAGMLIVIDNLNQDFSNVTTERLQIESYYRGLGAKLPFPVGVFLMKESGLEELTPVLTNGIELADTLHGKMAEMVQERVTVGFYAEEERLNTSLQAFAELGRDVLNISGRKLVVWIGPGWPVIDSSEGDIGPEQEKYFYTTALTLSHMLREERIAVDIVNPVGATAGTSGKELYWESFTKPLTKQNKAEPGNVALQVFAIHSGGTVVFGSNDIAKEIARCSQDASAWYSISFDESKAGAPNTWHDLDVKTTKSQTKVRTLNGYYTQP